MDQRKFMNYSYFIHNSHFQYEYELKLHESESKGDDHELFMNR
jgi:hypothetical protein